VPPAKTTDPQTRNHFCLIHFAPNRLLGSFSIARRPKTHVSWLILCIWRVMSLPAANSPDIQLEDFYLINGLCIPFELMTTTVIGLMKPS